MNEQGVWGSMSQQVKRRIPFKWLRKPPLPPWLGEPDRLEGSISGHNKGRANGLARVQLALQGVLLLLIICTPFLVDEGFPILDEEFAESIIILLLIVLSSTVFALYRREIRRKERSLSQFTQRIGTLNLQFERIRRLYEDIEHWTYEHRSFQWFITSLADRVLQTTNGAWVVLRVIEPVSGRTLTECTRKRRRSGRFRLEISNRKLLESVAVDGHSVISRDYLNLKSFCILPEPSISEAQSFVIGVILDNLGLLYVAFRRGKSKGRSADFLQETAPSSAP